jgi:hypothetical protein
MVSCATLISQQLVQLVFGEFRILQNLVQQTRPDYFTSMDGNHSSATVGVMKEVMAAFDSQYRETGSFEC